jgi:hypothetical protein
MPVSEVAEILDDAQAFAQEADRLKQRSGRSPRAPRPGARAAWAANALLDPGAPLWLANPCADAVEFSRAVVSAFSATRFGRSPEAAADVLRNTASRLHR